ncbi:MAG TPA: histidinol-phosphatase [Alphaproteobacteria bacterium]|nr:histidinol-phosphatase [Alphaproteobacteria bacterium]
MAAAPKSAAAGVPLEALLSLAERLADASEAVIKRYWRTRLEVDQKADLSPVTAADRDSEAAMRRLINEAWPDHGILGEEYGPERTEAAYVWVLDPIDGTKSFITGKPLFGTLIGLLHEGRTLLGVINMPALGERWVGAAGRGASFNGARVSPRACASLAEAAIFSTSPYMFAPADRAAYERVREAAKLALFGTDCYAYGLVASGTADLVIEGGLGTYDFIGPAAVIEAAGGIATDWQGRPLGLGSDGRVVAAGDRRCHEAALALLGA